MSLDEARPAGRASSRPAATGRERGDLARAARTLRRGKIASQPRSRQATGGVRPAGEGKGLAKPLDAEELLATVAEVAGPGVPPGSGSGGRRGGLSAAPPPAPRHRAPPRSRP